MTLSSPARDRLRAVLLGSDAPLRAMAIAGAVAGILPNLDRMQRLDPFLLFAVPAWYLHVLSRIFGFLRRPRQSDLTFVLGIDYATRIGLASSFVNRRGREALAAAVVASVVLTAARAAIFGAGQALDGAALSCAVLAACAVCHAAMVAALRTSLLRPSRPLRLRLGAWQSTRHALRVVQSAACSRLAPLAARLLRGTASIALRRNILYLMRHDPLTLLLLLTGGVASQVVALCALGAPYAAARLLLTAALPAVILFQATPTMLCAARMTFECPYYALPARVRLTAGAAIAAILWLPFALVYAASELFLGASIAAAGRILVMTLVAVSSVYGFSRAWMRPDWSASAAGHVATTLLLSVWAIMAASGRSPVHGAVVALAAIAAGWVFAAVDRAFGAPREGLDT